MSAEFETAKKRAMYLLGGKDYSKKELRDKLLKNYSPETCEAVIEKMSEYGFLDDERYAKKLARKYILVQKYGKTRAKMMMIQKGLGPSLADEALRQYSTDDLITEIVGIIEKKYYDRLFIEGLEGKKELQKVMASLARRGYGFEEIKKAVSIVKSEADFDFYED
ncbi:MAG: regulatory protein RecX [Ruminiclostridium sp.]|nr:regulatory protein RecX [Ruminiclostridium sp.]MBQ8842582.1 regulatory protein RecX [Ruminiclostridium sp.]